MYGYRFAAWSCVLGRFTDNFHTWRLRVRVKLDMPEQPLSSPVKPAFLSSYTGASDPQGVRI